MNYSPFLFPYIHFNMQQRNIFNVCKHMSVMSINDIIQLWTWHIAFRHNRFIWFPYLSEKIVLSEIISKCFQASRGLKNNKILLPVTLLQGNALLVDFESYHLYTSSISFLINSDIPAAQFIPITLAARYIRARHVPKWI